MNRLILEINNITGILPNYWFNSTVFSYIDIGGSSLYVNSKNVLRGTIPDFKYILPNLSFLGLTKQYFNHTDYLPSFGFSNCTVNYDLHDSFDPKYRLKIPYWNDQKYMSYVSLENIQLDGTIPQWDNWIWPFDIRLVSLTINTYAAISCKLSGSIPKFNKNVCALLNAFILSNCQINGTIDSFPPAICIPENPEIWYDLFNWTTSSQIDFHNNQLTGNVPFDSLTSQGFVSLADNYFNGSVDFGQNVPYNMTTLIAINLTNNSFTGTFPCLSNNFALEYIDIRQNNFELIENNCQWSNKLKYFLASYNPKLTQSFDDITYGMYSMNVLALGVTRLYGSVNNIDAIKNGGAYLAFYDSDIATTLPNIAPNATWNQSWVIIGLTISSNLPSWVGMDEKQLEMILVTQNDLWLYFIAPLICCFVAMILYCIYDCVNVKQTSILKLANSYNYNHIEHSDDSDRVYNGECVSPITGVIRRKDGNNYDNNYGKAGASGKSDLLIQDILGDFKPLGNSYSVHSVSFDPVTHILSPSISPSKQGQSGKDTSKHWLLKEQISQTDHSFNVNHNKDTNKADNDIVLVDLFLNDVMKLVQRFLLSLLCITFVPMGIIYYYGSNWVSNGTGFQSLKMSVTYLGTHNHYSNEEIWIILSVVMFIIYSWICAYYSIKIIQNCSRLSKESMTVAEKLHKNSTVNSIANQKSKVCHCIVFLFRTILSLALLALLILFVTLPIGLYNLYHSLPIDNNIPIIGNLTRSNSDHYDTISYIIENFTSLIIAFQQWFLIAPCVRVVINTSPLVHRSFGYHALNSNHDEQDFKSQTQYYHNFLIQVFRNFTFIVLPFTVLFIFDDKCLQNWKYFWPKCTNNPISCEFFQSEFFLSNQIYGVSLCFYICDKFLFMDRCLREVFQVLRPLYTMKATIGLLFPIYFHLMKKLMITIQNCTSSTNRTNAKDHDHDQSESRHQLQHQLDVEYIGLISSLEILIIFGWGLPILIPIYTGIMFGYSVVSTYWWKRQSHILIGKANARHINIVGKWVVASIIIQQIFAIMFYVMTQLDSYKTFLIINALAMLAYIAKNMLFNFVR